MRIAFFGLPLAALLLDGDGHDLVYAGLSRPAYPGERRLRRALAARATARGEGIPVAIRPDVDDPALAEALRAARPDLVVSWFWTTRLPPSLVGVAPLGGFGVHPSLLPRHRGPDPYFWTLDSGDATTGVTAHELDAEYDTGAILGRRELAVDPSWSAWTLAKRLDRPSHALLRETARAFADALAAGRPRPSALPQDEALATDAPAPDDESLEIDWTWPASRVARRVRAASPSPGAYTFLGETSVTLTRVAEAARFPRNLAPGEAAVVDGEDGIPRAVVRAGDGALALLEGVVETEEGEPERVDGEGLVRLVRLVEGAAEG